MFYQKRSCLVPICLKGLKMNTKQKTKVLTEHKESLVFELIGDEWVEINTFDKLIDTLDLSNFKNLTFRRGK
jgi:hypothetical protein